MGNWRHEVGLGVGVNSLRLLLSACAKRRVTSDPRVARRYLQIPLMRVPAMMAIPRGGRTIDVNSPMTRLAIAGSTLSLSMLPPMNWRCERNRNHQHSLPRRFPGAARLSSTLSSDRRELMSKADRRELAEVLLQGASTLERGGTQSHDAPPQAGRKQRNTIPL